MYQPAVFAIPAGKAGINSSLLTLFTSYRDYIQRIDNIEIPMLGEIGGPGDGEYFLLCDASDDPCFLGRRYKIYNEPRRVLGSIPCIHLIEMERNRRWSYCCGSGAKIIIKYGKA